MAFSKYLAIGLVILVVRYVIASSIPTQVALFGFHGGIYKRHHSIVVLRIGFYEVYDVENVFTVLPCVANFEIKPLCVILGVVIRLKH